MSRPATTFALFAALLASCDRPPVKPEPAKAQDVAAKTHDVPTKANAFYGTLPAYQQPLATAKVPDGLGDISAQTCGACHQAIYQEWSISTHRRAWADDPQFMAELAKSRGAGKAGGDVSWMCVNCHTPLTNQIEQLVVGLRDGRLDQPIYAPNPSYDRDLQHEAITCAACHVRDGVIHGPRGDGRLAPHPVAKSEELTSEALCTRCHQAQAVFPEIDLGCFFGTGEEFATSPAAARGDTCQTCHMPTVTRKIAEPFDVPVRETRRHWFGGSLIAKQPRFAAELEPLQDVFGDAVELRLEEASPATRPAEHQVPGADRLGCADDAASCIRLAVVVANENAGHHFPTGDPERHADIIAEAVAPDGTVIARTSMRIASKFQWWPTMERLWDNRIPAGSRRAFLLDVPARDFTVRLRATKNRMYPDAVKHHQLEDATVVGRPFHDSVWRVEAGIVQPANSPRNSE